MPNGTDSITPPAGYTLEASTAAATAPAAGGITPPAGYTLEQPSSAAHSQYVQGAPMPADVAARHARANAGLPAAPPQEEPGVMQNLAEGFGKTAAEGIQGVTKLVNKALPAGAQIPVPGADQDLATKGIAQTVGGLGASALEWTMGEESLKALSELSQAAKFMKTPAMLADYLKSSPKATKALEAIAHGMAIGGVQGAVHGAAQDETGRGAAFGAVGGGVGAAAGEALSTVGMKVLDKMGIGLSSEEAMTRAAGGSLNVGTQDWPGSVKKALPLIQNLKFSTVGEFADGVHDSANKLWKGVIQPQVDRHAKDTVDMKDVRTAIQDVVSPTLKKHFPEEAAEIERFANTFDSPKSVSELSQTIQDFNARLKSFYRNSAEGKAAAIKSDSEAAATESAVSKMRDLLYGQLDAAGEKTPAAFREQYGALKEVERVFDKRATIDTRRAKLTMNELLAWTGGAAALAEGVSRMGASPLHAAGAAALPAAASALKYTQAPTTLLKRAMSTAAPSAVRQAAGAVGDVAGAAAKTGLAAGGAQAGQAWVNFTGKDGKKYVIHPDDFEEAKKRGLVQK